MSKPIDLNDARPHKDRIRTVLRWIQPDVEAAVRQFEVTYIGTSLTPPHAALEDYDHHKQLRELIECVLTDENGVRR